MMHDSIRKNRYWTVKKERQSPIIKFQEVSNAVMAARQELYKEMDKVER